LKPKIKPRILGKLNQKEEILRRLQTVEEMQEDIQTANGQNY